MKIGDIVKLSEYGLNTLYPRYNTYREKARLYRLEVIGGSYTDNRVVRVKALHTPRHYCHSYFDEFLEVLE